MVLVSNFGQLGSPAVLSDAQRLNASCFCVTLDRNALRNALDSEIGSAGFADELARSHPSLFSHVPLFIDPRAMAEMVGVVAAVEAAVQLPAYREAALAWAAPIAISDRGPAGALMGYDFHLTPDGAQLIEINTNAGGAFLNSVLADSQQACCDDPQASTLLPRRDFGAAVAAMFIEEWRRQRGEGRPPTIAIVDDAPEDQYLFPEFQLAKSVLEEHGFVAVIADATTLVSGATGLTFGGQPIDLVYNRLVDFGFDEPRHAALRNAYSLGSVVVTPNPHIHALFADKRNLTLLSDADQVKRWGLESLHRDALRAAVPLTVTVTSDNSDALWNDRRKLFFKPARGHGSKAAYRGNKLTRKVWSEILDTEYVAQLYAPPSERMVTCDGIPTILKVDIRLYTYEGAVMLTAARLYRGQTTNMRTPGGGFAPVLELAHSPRS